MATQTQTPTQQTSAPQNIDNSQFKKVLLVEDDEFLSSIIKARLSKSGVEITHAKNGEDAIKSLQTSIPDLILLDLILPKMSGFEVMQQIRENPQVQNAPIIIISNLGQPEDIQKGKTLGAVEYFIKAKTSIDDLVNNILGFLKN